MNKFLKWIKNHVRFHFGLRSDKMKKNRESVEEQIDSLRDRTEVGIKFKFKI
jgi:hypothetical protein